MSDVISEFIDKTGRKIRLTRKQWKHIQKHPHMHNSAEKIEETIKNPVAIRHDEFNPKLNYFYKEYKNIDLRERYLFVSVKYLNGDGFVITSFYTNKITGLK